VKPNFKKLTAITVSFVGSLLWGTTSVLENQNALAQVGGVFIQNELSNTCIDVFGEPGTVNGTQLQIYTCELSGFSPAGRTTDQKWEFTRGGFIRNTLSNRCIDVEGEPGISNSARLIISNCELSGFSPLGRTTDQKWEYINAGFIRNELSNKCIDVFGEPGTVNDRQLILADCELSGFSRPGRTTDQRWRLQPSF